VNVILLDIRIEELNGIGTLGEIQKRGWKTPVIVLTQYDEQALVLHLQGLGISGLLHKNSDPAELAAAIRMAVGVFYNVLHQFALPLAVARINLLLQLFLLGIHFAQQALLFFVQTIQLLLIGACRKFACPQTIYAVLDLLLAGGELRLHAGAQAIAPTQGCDRILQVLQAAEFAYTIQPVLPRAATGIQRGLCLARQRIRNGHLGVQPKGSEK